VRTVKKKIPPRPVLSPEEIEAERVADAQEKQISNAAIAAILDQYGPEKSSQVLSLSLSMSQFTKPLFVPTFQRPVVWNSEKQIRFCQNVLRGIPLAGFMLWERDWKSWVVDGQQRMTALGIPLMRGGWFAITYRMGTDDYQIQVYTLRGADLKMKYDS